MIYNCIVVETRGEVGLIRLNRPKQRNALNDELMNELALAILSIAACKPSRTYQFEQRDWSFGPCGKQTSLRSLRFTPIQRQ